MDPSDTLTKSSEVKQTSNAILHFLIIFKIYIFLLHNTDTLSSLALASPLY